ECLTAADCCANQGFVCDAGECARGMISDRQRKRDIASVDPADMLARAAALPVASWSYTFDDPAVRHIGPMAQDFAALFGVGADDRHIHPVDGQGVALAAIQGLYAEVRRLQGEQAALQARLAELEAEQG
ncbi:MAG TPA: tail fiber domain-containing protein, partial [Thermomicrobiales bacterium]|nr:tail fiber domain-containing protein [Thermomicrobiales bacterium]